MSDMSCLVTFECIYIFIYLQIVCCSRHCDICCSSIMLFLRACAVRFCIETGLNVAIIRDKTNCTWPSSSRNLKTITVAKTMSVTHVQFVPNHVHCVVAHIWYKVQQAKMRAKNRAVADTCKPSSVQGFLFLSCRRRDHRHAGFLFFSADCTTGMKLVK